MKLTINSQEVLLGEDFGTEIVFANPFFTKDGGYTLDISIDLKIPANAAVYRFINRKGQHARPEKRSAVLSHAGRVIIQGTEIILSVEDSVAKIQIVGDNSQLNYFTSQRKNIRDIPMPIGLATSGGGISSNAELCYPDADYCYPHMLKKANVRGKMDLQMLNKFNSRSVVPASQNYPAPYLLYIVRMVLEDAGYSIGENYISKLADNNRIFIVPQTGITMNGRSNVKVNFEKMLPAWSSNEFISEIEKLFNVSFVTHEFSKIVDIIGCSEYYKGKKNFYYIASEDVVDDIGKTFGVENSLWLNYANIKYNLPSDIYYKYSDIDPDIIERCNDVQISNKLPDESTVGTYNLYYNFSGNYRVVWRPVETGADKNTIMVLQQACNFQRKVDDVSDDETSFKIIPAKIVATKVKGYLDRGTETGYLTCPLIDELDYDAFESSEFVEEEDEIGGLNKDIENGIEEDKIASSLKIAFYNGFTKLHKSVPGSCFNKSRGTLYASQSQTTNAVVYSKIDDKENLQVFECDSENRNLSVAYRYDHFYKDTVKVDTSVEYEINFLCNGIIYDPKNVFVLGNRMFYCKEIKYFLRTDGFSDICSGTFYAYSE